MKIAGRYNPPEQFKTAKPIYLEYDGFLYNATQAGIDPDFPSNSSLTLNKSEAIVFATRLVDNGWRLDNEQGTDTAVQSSYGRRNTDREDALRARTARKARRSAS